MGIGPGKEVAGLQRKGWRVTLSLASPSSSHLLSSGTTPSVEVDVVPMAEGKDQVTGKHNTNMLQLTDNHGNGQMTGRSSGNI